jgi:hypothetical protein
MSVTTNAINSNIPIEIAKGGTNASSISNTNGVNYFDGTRIVTTGAGSAGQVLTSRNPSSGPIYQPSPAYAFVSRIVVSSPVPELLFNNLPSNKNYLLIYESTQFTKDRRLALQFSSDNGSTFITTGYQSILQSTPYNTATVNYGFVSSDVRLSTTQGTANAGCGKIFFYGFNQSSTPLIVMGQGRNNRSTSRTVNVWSSISATNVNSFKLVPTTASNFILGTATLYVEKVS